MNKFRKVMAKIGLLASAALVVAGVGVVVQATNPDVQVPSASATNPQVTGVYKCEAGVRKITWTVASDPGYPNETATVKFQLRPTVDTLMEKSVKIPNTISGTEVVASTGTYTFYVKVQWTNHAAGDWVTSNTASVNVTGACNVPADPKVVLTGVATCQADYTYKVDWTVTITDNGTLSEIDLKVIKHLPAGSLINGVDAQVWLYEWIEHHANHGLPAFPPGGIATFTQTGIPGTATSATAAVQFDFKGGPSGDPEKTITLSGDCVKPHPTQFTPQATSTQQVCNTTSYAIEDANTMTLTGHAGQIWTITKGADTQVLATGAGYSGAPPFGIGDYIVTPSDADANDLDEMVATPPFNMSFGDASTIACERPIASVALSQGDNTCLAGETVTEVGKTNAVLLSETGDLEGPGTNTRVYGVSIPEARFLPGPGVSADQLTLTIVTTLDGPSNDPSCNAKVTLPKLGGQCYAQFTPGGGDGTWSAVKQTDLGNGKFRYESDFTPTAGLVVQPGAGYTVSGNVAHWSGTFEKKNCDPVLAMTGDNPWLLLWGALGFIVLGLTVFAVRQVRRGKPQNQGLTILA